MTTVTLTLAEFLLARIAEDETLARMYSENGWEVPDKFDWPRVLAECEAKRRIVELHPADGFPDEWMDAEDAALFVPFCAWCTYDSRTVNYPCPTLRALASVYVDHPDFHEEWRA